MWSVAFSETELCDRLFRWMVLRFSRPAFLSLPDDREKIANYRNPTYVLGNDWNPKITSGLTGVK